MPGSRRVMARAAVAAVLAIGIAAGWVSSPGASAAPPGLKVGDAAPPFVLKDLSGVAVDLSALAAASRAVVVNFWGLRCGACIEEIPGLNRIFGKYKASGLAVVGINVDGVNADVIKAQLPRLQNTPVYPLVTDEEMRVADLYRLGAAPFTLLVDPRGKIVYLHEGYTQGDEAELERLVGELIGPR